EGSSNNKALEVYNPTDETLSLDNYIIYTNYNGNSWTPGDGGRYTFPSGATVLPGEVFVAASADAWDEVLQAADSAYAYGDGAYITSFNGDDARGLAKIHDGD
ncbi:MAG: lamin tail domain-containing protein, partial [Candidatus Pacebacteria bacterium]|nr:lamin tail domain-containing protein [Candidatus Paceibacterota bacterium]